MGGMGFGKRSPDYYDPGRQGLSVFVMSVLKVYWNYEYISFHYFPKIANFNKFKFQLNLLDISGEVEDYEYEQEEEAAINYLQQLQDYQKIIQMEREVWWRKFGIKNMKGFKLCMKLQWMYLSIESHYIEFCTSELLVHNTIEIS